MPHDKSGIFFAIIHLFGREQGSHNLHSVHIVEFYCFHVYLFAGVEIVRAARHVRSIGGSGSDEQGRSQNRRNGRLFHVIHKCRFHGIASRQLKFVVDIVRH